MPATALPLTAAQAADRLGVELATVYAYASRGSLTRRPGPDGRTSRYDADEVELLARRARPRSTRRRPGAVDVVIGTTVSEIGDGWIRYRGYDLIGELAGQASFDEVAELLWTGDLPAPGAHPTDRAGVRARRAVEQAAGRASAALPADAPTSSRFAVGAAAASSILRREAVEAPGGRGALLIDALLASLPVADGATAPAGDSPTVAQRLWARVSSLAPTAPRVAALDLALVLVAEHELATSTLAVRVAASTGAGPAEVLLAGIGTVAGPRHGQAAVRVHERLLARANAPTGPDEVSLEGGPHADGFGHIVHRHGDPRFRPLLEVVQAIASPRRRAVIDADLTSARRSGALPPNVDAALGALGYACAAQPGATEAIFTVARTAGWLAHAYEEADEPPLRYRGSTLYRGPRPDFSTGLA